MAKTLITGAAQSVTEVARRAAEAAKSATAKVIDKDQSEPKTPRVSAKAKTSSSSTKRFSAKKASGSKAKMARK